MKKTILVLISVVYLISSVCGSVANSAEEKVNALSEQRKPTFTDKLSFLPVLWPNYHKRQRFWKQGQIDIPSANQEFPINIEKLKSQFYLTRRNADVFSIRISSDFVGGSQPPERTKNYFKPALEISRINLIVWAFDKYILKGSWANISLKSISENLKYGYGWDYDDFGTNHFGHAYHGAMYHSAARFHGLSFVESTLYTALGSFMWEFFWESERPGANDSILSTLGGMTLGEALYRIADLIPAENVSGFARTLQKSLKFLINPSVGIKGLSGKIFRPGRLAENHLYSFKIPLGAYRSSDNESSFLIATQLEYKDVFRENNSKISPYDWFSFDARLGLDDNGIRDPEIFTSGILFGRKFKNGLAGLFGLFDYIDTRIADKMSVVGMGPGFVTSSLSGSKLVFNTSGMLSFIIGGSSASIDFEDPHFDKEPHDPYHFGPGILGRVKLELGLKSLGSIHTGFSRYWVHSLYTDADEFMSMISLDFNCDLSAHSQIRLGCDYYLRNANYQDQRFAVRKNALRAMYVLNF